MAITVSYRCSDGEIFSDEASAKHHEAKAQRVASIEKVLRDAYKAAKQVRVGLDAEADRAIRAIARQIGETPSYQLSLVKAFGVEIAAKPQPAHEAYAYDVEPGDDKVGF